MPKVIINHAKQEKQLNYRPLENNLRVAAYCRVSTDLQSQETSIESQKRYYEEYINARDNWNLVGIYSDEGKSGTNMIFRDEFNQMIKDAHDGKIDFIITKSVSRFARNTVDSIQTLKELRAKNIGVFFETENMNTLDPTWELIITFQSALAQEESRAKSNSVKWGFARKFEKGESLVSLLYGYRKQDHKYVVIDNEANIVKRIYREFLEGKSINGICNDLNKDNIPTRLSKSWRASTISSMIQNEKYTGNSLQGKTYSTDYTSKKRNKNEGQANSYYIENAHPAIISQEVYDSAQREMHRRKTISLEKANFGNNYKKCNAYSHKYPLGNFLECKHCGSKYRRQIWTARGNRRVVWRCTNRLKNGVAACPDAVTLHEDKIKHIIMVAIHSSISNTKGIKDNLQTRIHKLEQEYCADVEQQLLDDMNVLENKYESLIKNQIHSHNLLDSTIQNQMQDLLNAISHKKEELSTFKDNSSILKNDLIYYQQIQQELDDNDNLTLEYSDNILRTRINKILISKDCVDVILLNGYEYKYKL